MRYPALIISLLLTAVVSAQVEQDTAITNAHSRALRSVGVERAAAYNALSMAFIKASRSTDAWAAADTALSMAQGDSARAECLLQRALASDYDSRYEEGLKDAQEAIDIAHGLRSWRMELAGLFRCQSIQLNMQHFARSREYGQRWLATAGDQPDPKLLKKVLNNLAGAFYQERQLDSAEVVYRRLYAGLAPDDKVFRNMVLVNLSNLLSDRGQYDQALAMTDSAAAVLQDDSPSSHFGLMTTKGYILFSAGRYAESIVAFDSAEVINQSELHDLVRSVEVLGYTADAYDSLGMNEEVIRRLRLLSRAKDSLNNLNNSERIHELEETFQADLRKKDIGTLTASNAEKAERIKRKDQLLYAGIVVVALALIASALFYRNWRQKRKHADLLAGLNRTLEGQKTEIEEVNRLLQLKVLRTQMNPHFIYNSLSAIAALTQKGEHVQALSYLQGFARLLRQVLDHSVSDRVPLSEELDFLRQYLKLEALRFKDGFTYTVDADRALLDDDVEVPALLVQPFVENAVWHGLAHCEGEKRLSVRFAHRNGAIECTVEDNGMGRGFKPGPRPDGHKSVGVQLTNERLELLAFRLGEEGRARYEDLLTADGAPAGTRVSLDLADR